jgi:hypothetical protein
MWILLAACAVATAYDFGPMSSYDPFWPLEGGTAACHNVSLEKALKQGRMVAALDQRRIAVPFELVLPVFLNTSIWPAWNLLFSNVATPSSAFALCKPLVASFHILPDLNFGTATLRSPTIVRRLQTSSSVHLSWVYQFARDDGSFSLFGRHDYVLAAGQDSTTWLLSWEKGAGPLAEDNRRIEEHTLQKATLGAMEGFQCLEDVYVSSGTLTSDSVVSLCGKRDPRQLWEAMVDGGYYMP